METPTIGQVAERDVPTARLEDRLGDVRAKAEKAGWDTAIVINDVQVVLGRLFKVQFEMEPDSTVESVMKPGPSTFRPNVSVPEMVEYMSRNELMTAPVTTSQGVLIGLVFKEELDRISERKSAKSHRSE